MTTRSRRRRDGTGYGMSVQPLTREQARQLELDATSGVLVTDVQPSGRAADAGLRRGDVINEVDGKDVDSVETLRSLLKTGEPAGAAARAPGRSHAVSHTRSRRAVGPSRMSNGGRTRGPAPVPGAPLPCATGSAPACDWERRPPIARQP